MKCGKYSPVKFANFVYFCIRHGKALPLCGNVVTLFYAQYKSIQNSQTLHCYIFDILQYFTTKFHHFAKFRNLFPTVLKLFSNLKVCVIGKWSIVIFFLPYLTAVLSGVVERWVSWVRLVCQVNNSRTRFRLPSYPSLIKIKLQILKQFSVRSRSCLMTDPPFCRPRKFKSRQTLF